MTYPPPLASIFLAYQFGKITRKEYEHLMILWTEKHRDKKEAENNLRLGGEQYASKT